MRALGVLCVVAALSTAGVAHADDQLTLAFAGDVMFGRFVPGGFDPIRAEDADPFASVAPILTAADLAFVNLETPVMTTPPATSPWGTRMRFVATPARLATVAAAGIDVVSIANNHYYDMRAAGVAETPGLIAAAGLTAIGSPLDVDPIRVETIEHPGWRIAVIAASTVRNGDQRIGQPLLPYVQQRDLIATIAPLVTAARTDHDLVLVVMHWGTEYADAPSRPLIKAAHAFVDAGADAVIGSHPHVLQAIERYRGAVIAYSLGNFLFDNTREIVRQTGVLTVEFTRPTGGASCLRGASFAPALIDARPIHHPSLALDGRGRAVRERVRRLSRAKAFATSWQIDDDGRLVVAGACPALAP